MKKYYFKKYLSHLSRKYFKLIFKDLDFYNLFKPVRPAPATPKRDPIIATPAVVLIAAALALPRMTPSPAPIKGAASPPVNPTNVPPAIVATPIEAYLFIFRILSLRFTSCCSDLF